MKTCVFGGTFNPVHNGHISLAANVKNMLQPDRMIIIPSRVPPHKSSEELVDSVHRYEMAKIAADIVGCEVSDIELRRSGVSYTVYTLEELRAAGLDGFYLLMGSDMFFYIEKWYEFRRIMDMSVLVTAPRRAEETDELNQYAEKLGKMYGARSIVCDFQVTDISSTQLRNMMANGENVKDYIPDQVMQYIEENGLYTRVGT